MLNKNLFLCGCAIFATILSLQSQNLIQNGNFEQGNAGFTSGLRYLTSSDRTPGIYTVGADAHAFQVDFPACTAGGGKMMIVNGDLNVSKIWEQTITVVPNQTYTVSFWYQNVTPIADNLSLLLSVNGVVIGRDSTEMIQPCTWYPVRGEWNSGNNTTATIRISDTYNIFTGDDFAIDNIAFENSFSDMSLKEFTATRAASNVNVAWSTDFETGISHFELQRSINNKQFLFLAKEVSKGSGKVVRDYSVVDNTPSVGTNYYRLKTVDFKGKETFSKTVSVDFTDKTSAKIFPNPSKADHVTLALEVEKEGKYTIEWIDAIGRVRLVQERTVAYGVNNLDANVAFLESGIYLIRIKNAGKVLQTLRFVKMQV